jgi:benzoyl-CoA reductase/2-hydroxyglutaryl-CoA dehydratase subunit BcrC/BadD/HgdB
MESRTALNVDSRLIPLYSDIRELSSIKRMYQHNASVWDSWAKHISKGGKVVGTSANSPIELLRAAGVFSVIYKRREDLNRAIIKSDLNLSKWIYHFGVGECVCRHLNGSAGSPILGACPGYDIVITDFLPKLDDWNNMIISIGSDWDFEFLELPQSLSRKEREIAIYEKLASLKERLQKLTGKPITNEMIADSIKLTNEVTDVFDRIDTLIKAEPHPLKSFDIYNLKVICTDYIGGITDELLGISYLLEDELRERVENGTGYQGKKILLAGGFKNEFLHAIDSNSGIVTSAWPFQRFTAHREKIRENGDILGSLASWYAGHSGLGSPEENALDFVDLVKHYEVDAVIYNEQCPFGSRSVYDSHESIKDSVQLPFLSLEAQEENPTGLIGEFMRTL